MALPCVQSMTSAGFRSSVFCRHIKGHVLAQDGYFFRPSKWAVTFSPDGHARQLSCERARSRLHIFLEPLFPCLAFDFILTFRRPEVLRQCIELIGDRAAVTGYRRDGGRWSGDDYCWGCRGLFVRGFERFGDERFIKGIQLSHQNGRLVGTDIDPEISRVPVKENEGRAKHCHRHIVQLGVFLALPPSCGFPCQNHAPRNPEPQPANPAKTTHATIRFDMRSLPFSVV